MKGRLFLLIFGTLLSKNSKNQQLKNYLIIAKSIQGVW
jgi:hypothetical protein